VGEKLKLAISADKVVSVAAVAEWETLSSVPESQALEVEVKSIAFPVVNPSADKARIVPVVALSAVKLNIPVPVYTPVLVIAKSAPVVFVVAIETMSLAVAGESVVEALDQYPAVPEDEPVIFPVQVRLPVVPASAIEQRVLVPSVNAKVPVFPIETVGVVSVKAISVSQPVPKLIAVSVAPPPAFPILIAYCIPFVVPVVAGSMLIPYLVPPLVPNEPIARFKPVLVTVPVF